MKELVNFYIESKSLAWSPSTQRSELSRLKANIGAIEMGPEQFFRHCKTRLKPYAIKTTFIRLADFYQWLLDNQHKKGTNTFQLFIRINKKLFNNVYEKERLEIGFEEALQKIKAISDVEVREKALQLISCGARWTESNTMDERGFVIGKGGRSRKLFNAKSFRFTKSYQHFLCVLKKETGLKPHSLRKLFATHLANSGFTAADLTAALGWTSMAPALSYLQAKKEDELQTKIMELVG